MSSHGVLGRGESGEGGCRDIGIGICSEPVDWRDVASHWGKVGNMSGFANARSMALGRFEPEKGQQM